jgi:hypothetical protein
MRRSLTDRQHRAWFGLLCYAAEQPDPGKIDRLPAVLVAAEATGGDLDLLVETCNALQALQSVTWRFMGDSDPQKRVEITFIRFAERQHKKPSDAPDKVKERVGKCRGNKKLKQSEQVVTPCNAPCNADVTPETSCITSYELPVTTYPPTPPGGAGVVDDQEPFVPPPSNGQPPPIPPETARMIAVIDGEFPGYGYGALAAKAGWIPQPGIDAALETKRRGKDSFAYMTKVYRTNVANIARPATPARECDRLHVAPTRRKPA